MVQIPSGYYCNLFVHRPTVVMTHEIVKENEFNPVQVFSLCLKLYPVREREHERAIDCGEAVESGLGLGGEGIMRDIIDRERRWVVVSGGGGVCFCAVMAGVAENGD
ncbi:hypothetical protein ACE6H2_021362 [Prunus campanulata]